jgi:hypothetical protein
MTVGSNREELLEIAKEMDLELIKSRGYVKICNNNEAEMWNRTEHHHNPNENTLKKFVKRMWGCKKARKILKVLDATYENLPLHINDKHYAARAIVKWRLKKEAL